METNDPQISNQANSTALSIYGQADAAMDDFPVLKAFQQYIDAEQSKSRKRMILLCMFFGVLMTILVAVFVLVLAQLNRDKQQVNDQLIQFLMKERERTPAPAPVQQPVVQAPASNPAQDAAFKAMTETLTALQKQMADQKKAAAEEAAKAPTKAELELQRKTERENEKIRRAQEQLAEEKRRLADEKEKLRQQEVERQRRRLYPEYYEKKGESPSPSAPAAEKKETVRPKPKRDLTDAEIDEILKEVDQIVEEEDEETGKPKSRAKAKSKAKASSKKNGEKKKADGDSKVDQPIEYFTDTEYAVPVSVNGEDVGMSIPLPDDAK